MGGAVGVKCALTDNRSEPSGDKRVIVICGDGAFQETCQSISTMIKLGHNNVIFVLNNGIYGVE